MNRSFNDDLGPCWIDSDFVELDEPKTGNRNVDEHNARHDQFEGDDES